MGDRNTWLTSYPRQLKHEILFSQCICTTFPLFLNNAKIKKCMVNKAEREPDSIKESLGVREKSWMCIKYSFMTQRSAERTEK